MRSLSLLVLLLFAVIVCTTAQPSPPSVPTPMAELLANGALLRFKSFNNLYLTDEPSTVYFLTQPRQDWGRLQKWTIVQINDHEVAIKSNRGYYIGHGTSDWAKQAQVDGEWEMLTPVKNTDGSWSFKSRDNKWLSAHSYDGPERYYISFESGNNRCERWRLEPYTPPATPTPMAELLANGALLRFKSFNNLYLTDEPSTVYFLTQPRQDWGRLQKWTIVQINDREVAIKSNRGYYIGHGTSDWAKEAEVANEWEMLTPVKNEDGSWSFKSRDNKWLSAHSYDGPERYYISFESGNNRCERWRLEPYTPPATQTLMEQLLSNGGRRRFKSHNGRYLTDEYQFFVKPWNREKVQDFIIEQINENEVAIKSKGGYLSHRAGAFPETRAYPNAWEMLTPVKNGDGSWSFKSRGDKWLASFIGATTRAFFMSDNENKESTHWWLESY